MSEQGTYRPAWHCIDFVLDGTSPINTGIQLWQLDHWKITATVTPAAGNSNQAVAFGCLDESGSPYHGMQFRINGANTLNMQFQCNPNIDKKNYTGGNYHVVVEKDEDTLTYTAPNGDVFTADISAITYTGPLTIGDGWKNNAFLGRKFKGTLTMEVMVYDAAYLTDVLCVSVNSMLRRRQASYIDWSKFVFSVRDNSLFVSYLHSKGLCASKNGITQAECEAVTDMSQIFSSSNSAYLPNLDEFKYFVNIPSRGSVSYPFSRYVKEVTFPQGYTLGGGTFLSTKDDYIKERVTLNGGIFNDLLTSFYIDGSHATTGIYVRCFQLFGDVTLEGYNNANGVNSFKYCVMDKVQIGGGHITNWWPFMDVGVAISNRVYWDMPNANVPELPLKDYTVELIDAQGVVVSENDYYKKIDGSIYTKDGGTLCWYDRTATEVVIPQTCTKIATGAIGQMPNITRIVIPEWVTSLFEESWQTGNFINMPNLVEFRMDGGRTDRNYEGTTWFCRGVPNLRVASMTKLSANRTTFSFRGLSNLRVLTIHSAVRYFDSYISSMTNLQKLHLTNTSVVTTWNDKLADITCDIYVPDALVDSYKATTGWVDIADRIKPESEFNETYTE